jgi:hypothetical protein
MHFTRVIALLTAGLSQNLPGRNNPGFALLQLRQP